MNIWNNLRIHRDVSFVIRNEITGAYIHESLMKVKKFRTHGEALAFIRKRNLNRDIYFVEVRK